MPATRPAHRRDRVRATHHGDLVLVATDNGELRRLLCDLLDTHGYRAVIADAAARVEDVVAQLSPVVVLLDLDGCDGLTTIVQVRRRDTTPVIAMASARNAAALEAGAADCIAKPFRPKELLDSMRAAIRRERALDRLGD